MRQAMNTQNSKTLAKFLLAGKRPEGKPDALKGARPVWGNPKGSGDKSMSLKRGVSEDVYGTALQRLSDMAKAGLLESQCPVAEAHALR